MRYRLSKLLLCAACLLLMTGCWDRRELNTIGIAVGLGIDRIQNQYNISVQIVNPTQTSSNRTDNQAKVALYSQKSSTVMEAMRKVSVISPRIIYLSHLRLLVIGEEQAKKGILDVLDYLSRDHEVRADFYVVIAKDLKASDILSILTQIDMIPAIRIYNVFNLSSRLWAPTIGVKMDELLQEQGNRYGKSSVLSGIGVRGDLEKVKTMTSIQVIKPPGRLYYAGIAVLKHDKLVGWLDERDSESYSYLANKVDLSMLQIACGDKGKIVLDVMKSRTKLEASFHDNEPLIKAKIRINANVGEVVCPDSILDASVKEKIERQAAANLKDQLEGTVKLIQEKYAADIFGFGEVIYRKYPKQWRQLEPEWEKHFRVLPVEVDVKVKITHLGTISEQINSKEKESR